MERVEQVQPVPDLVRGGPAPVEPRMRSAGEAGRDDAAAVELGQEIAVRRGLRVGAETDGSLTEGGLDPDIERVVAALPCVWADGEPI